MGFLDKLFARTPGRQDARTPARQHASWRRSLYPPHHRTAGGITVTITGPAGQTAPVSDAEVAS